MKKRLRNVTTLEIRDVEVGSDEAMELASEVYTLGGVSKPRWILNSEWRVIEDARIAANAATGDKPVVHFSNRTRHLTPGEIASGITSYEQKEAELFGVVEEDEEDDSLFNSTEPDDEEEEEEDDAPPTPPRTDTAKKSAVRTKSRPRRRGTRASGATRAA